MQRNLHSGNPPLCFGGQFLFVFFGWALVSFLEFVVSFLAKRKSGWGVVLVGSLCDGFDEWPLYM